MLRPTPLSVGPCPPPLGLVICCGVALTGESPRLNGSKAKKFQGASGEARGGGELGRQASTVNESDLTETLNRSVLS